MEMEIAEIQGAETLGRQLLILGFTQLHIFQDRLARGFKGFNGNRWQRF